MNLINICYQYDDEVTKGSRTYESPFFMNLEERESLRLSCGCSSNF